MELEKKKSEKGEDKPPSLISPTICVSHHIFAPKIPGGFSNFSTYTPIGEGRIIIVWQRRKNIGVNNCFFQSSASTSTHSVFFFFFGNRTPVSFVRNHLSPLSAVLRVCQLRCPLSPSRGMSA